VAVELPPFSLRSMSLTPETRNGHCQFLQNRTSTVGKTCFEPD